MKISISMIWPSRKIFAVQIEDKNRHFYKSTSVDQSPTRTVVLLPPVRLQDILPGDIGRILRINRTNNQALRSIDTPIPTASTSDKQKTGPPTIIKNSKRDHPVHRRTMACVPCRFFLLLLLLCWRCCCSLLSPLHQVL